MRYLSTITIIASLCIGCRSDSMTPHAYMRFVQSSTYPGCISLDENIGLVLYKSATCMTLNAMSPQSWDQSIFNSSLSKFENLWYFEFTLRSESNQKRPAVLDEMAHYKNEKEIEKNIFLTVDHDTLRPILFQPERYYGLKEDRYILGFEKPNDKTTDATFIYKNEGRIYLAKFSRDQLLEPRIKW